MRQQAAKKNTGGTDDTRLHSWPLVAARVLILCTMAVTVGLFLLALPGSVSSLSTPCVDAGNQCLFMPTQIPSLNKIGFAPQAVAVVAVVLSCLALLAAEGAATVLLWRRSNDWMALLVALFLALAPVSLTPVLGTLRAGSGMLHIPTAVLGEVSSITLLLVLALFPNGRFVPRWLWVVIVILLLQDTPLAFFIPDLPGMLLVLVSLLCLVGGQIYRYRRVSTPVQRQQTKWVVYGLVFGILLNQLFWQPYLLIPALHQPDSLFILLAYPDDFIVLGVVVTCFGVAILRYRLWDIDTLINKALVYSALTALLGALYLGLVLGLETLAGAMMAQGQDQPVVLVVSTLVIAALFQPLRRRIQTLIDHRFYRRKYDAEKALAAFSTQLSHEVDLSEIRMQLLTIVQETMQPTSVSLWTPLAKQPISEIHQLHQAHNSGERLIEVKK